jgi:hypothetical protein
VIGRHDLTFFVWQLSLFSSTEKDGRWCAGPDADAPVLRSGQPLCVRRGAHNWDQSRTRHAHQDTRQRRASPAKRPSRQGAFVLIAPGKLRCCPASRNHDRSPHHTGVPFALAEEEGAEALPAADTAAKSVSRAGAIGAGTGRRSKDHFRNSQAPDAGAARRRRYHVSDREAPDTPPSKGHMDVTVLDAIVEVCTGGNGNES